MVWKKVFEEPFHNLTPELIMMALEEFRGPKLFLVISNKEKKRKGPCHIAKLFLV